jgi:hypothetical protein
VLRNQYRVVSAICEDDKLLYQAARCSVRTSRGSARGAGARAQVTGVSTADATWDGAGRQVLEEWDKFYRGG